MRVPQFIAVAWLALACALAPAHAEKRVALVIGNGAYVHADNLTNPVNDARGMRDALTGLKFDVIYGENLDGKALRRMIGRFNSRVEGADVALVYFAGHGATFGDTPYVVPIDAEFAHLDEMPAELVTIEELIGDLRRAKSVRIAILDACRDNGAEQALKRSRGGAPSRGLAPPRNPAGLIIAYATQHGATAADSAGSRNSPFTAALLHNIGTPGLDVKEMFFKVGGEVEAATSGRQRPEISISMYEPFALMPSARGNGGSAVSEAERAERTWAMIQNTASLEVIDEFLRQYGRVPVYGARARERREELANTVKPTASGVLGDLGLSDDEVKKPTSSRLNLGLDDEVEKPTSSRLNLGLAAPLTAAEERTLKPKETFQECENCPEMVVVPAGAFTMGSPASEKDRRDDEGPSHTVTISKPFAVGKLHVTVDQFAAFVKDRQHKSGAGCSWRSPGFVQKGSHPVVCVTWDDALAYVNWLAKKTGKPYRLLSEAEWEYAARGRTSPGTYPRFWFGNDEKELCDYGNFADQKYGLKNAPCDDGYERTSPAGNYAPNAFGLYDMLGNAWQWTADCPHPSYSGAPADGAAWATGTCIRGRVVRGSAWGDVPRDVRVANRYSSSAGDSGIGFRIARTLAP